MVKSVVKTFCRCFFEKANSRKSECFQGRFLNDCKAFRGFAFRAERVFARGGVPAACMLPKQARYHLRYIPIFLFCFSFEKDLKPALSALLRYPIFALAYASRKSTAAPKSRALHPTLSAVALFAQSRRATICATSRILPHYYTNRSRICQVEKLYTLCALEFCRENKSGVKITPLYFCFSREAPRLWQMAFR